MPKFLIYNIFWDIVSRQTVLWSCQVGLGQLYKCCRRFSYLHKEGKYETIYCRRFSYLHPRFTLLKYSHDEYSTVISCIAILFILRCSKNKQILQYQFISVDEKILWSKYVIWLYMLYIYACIIYIIYVYLLYYIYDDKISHLIIRL